MLRGTTFGGKYRKVQMLYLLRDPWEMEGPKEQYRFRQTMTQLRSLDTSFNSILEIGCGEGHQSLHFQTICTQLFGIDVAKLPSVAQENVVPAGSFPPCHLN